MFDAARSFTRALRVLLGAALVAGTSSTAWAQAGAPFPCDAQFYQIRIETSSNATYLVRYPTLTTAPTNAYASLPNGRLPLQLNALGFNSRDGYLYALSTGNSGNLYRLGQAGAELVGSIGGLTGFGNPTGAAFDEGGRYYLVGQGGGGISPLTVFRIDNIPPAGTSAALTVARSYALSGAANNFGDMAFSTASDGVNGILYGTTGTTHYRIQLNDAAATANLTTLAVAPSVGGIGSAFFDRPSNSFFVFNNGTNEFFRIDNFASGTPAAVAITAIPAAFVGAAGTTDGAQCAIATVEEADINVRKTVSPTTPVTFGQTVTFTVSVGNLGPSPAQSVTIADPLPPGLTLTSTSPSSGSYASGVWTLPSLPAFFTETLTLVASVNSTGTGTSSYANVATVSGSNRSGTTTVVALPDPVTSNNSGTATASASRSANLAITKTNTVNGVVAGQTTIYTITVSNLEGFNVANAVLRDPSTTGLDCSAAPAPACSVTPSPTGGTCPTVGTSPGQLSVANLQAAGGVIIPALNAGGLMSFTLTCTVTATGQ
ncbi:DUF11 domain-containing protein [Hydrogenophaga sp.]|uniref:DUF11 domain-containing protein n=1 Tax=Hydrogenophaga sp. TaxID=1904254 RepID=UPI002612621C|nr:DUF11 domain-containing protein [Hydrogenophaga sp.]MDM7950212.1 DUF11 domain-containing protein [Hydrogenophaga sp.]